MEEIYEDMCHHFQLFLSPHCDSVCIHTRTMLIFVDQIRYIFGEKLGICLLFLHNTYVVGAH